MSKIDTFRRLLKEDKRQILIAIYNNIVHTGITDILSDKAYLKLTYRIRFGKKLDLEHPCTFNEKLQWLKLYNHNKNFVKMVDKILAKRYVAKIIGKEYIIPTLGTYDSFDDINFDSLPNKFVLKCNHDSGSVIICKNKDLLDISDARARLTKGLKTDAYKWGREWPYKHVKRKIIAEQYLEENEFQELNDYKFMCFNGKVKCSFVCSDRFSGEGLKVTFYDTDWKIMPFERHYHKADKPIQKPVNYDKMVELAEKLAENIPFVRVDFYEVSKKIYFGELTFFPGSGWEEFNPPKWDKILGDWISLEDIRHSI